MCDDETEDTQSIADALNVPVHFTGVPPRGYEQRAEKSKIPIHAPAQRIPIFIAPEMIAKITAQHEPRAEENGGQFWFDGPGKVNASFRQDEKPQHEEQREKTLNETDIRKSFGFGEHELPPDGIALRDYKDTNPYAPLMLRDVFKTAKSTINSIRLMDNSQCCGKIIITL